MHVCIIFISRSSCSMLKKKKNNNNFSSKFFPPNREIVPRKIRAHCTIEEKKDRAYVYIYFFYVKKSSIINA